MELQDQQTKVIASTKQSLVDGLKGKNRLVSMVQDTLLTLVRLYSVILYGYYLAFLTEENRSWFTVQSACVEVLFFVEIALKNYYD